MAGQGIINIGLNVDYQKNLDKMIQDFKTSLTKITSEFKKTEIAADIEAQIAELAKTTNAEFDKINKGILNTKNIEEFREKSEKQFEKMGTQIGSLKQQIKDLGSEEAISGLTAKFTKLKEQITSSYEPLKEIIDFVNQGNSKTKASLPVSDKSLAEYRKTLADIKKLDYHSDMERILDFPVNGGNWDKHVCEQIKNIKDALSSLEAKKNELKTVELEPDEYIKIQNEIVRLKVKAQTAVVTLEKLKETDFNIGKKDLVPSVMTALTKLEEANEAFTEKSVEGYIKTAKNLNFEDFEKEAIRIVAECNKIQKAAKEAKAEVSTFQVKNGTIQVPIEVTATNRSVQKQLKDIIDKLQDYANKQSIIAKVKLTLDGGTTKGHKTNKDIAKQLEDGQSETGIDISKSIKKTYIQAVREAEKVAKESIASIQEIFNSAPVKLSIDRDTFISELKEIVNSSLGNIAQDTAGLDVNGTLGEMVSSLKEVSAILTGAGEFKLGLDETSINRITAAIESMANMIKRAFGVASDNDIANQWAAIEDKLESIANKEDKAGRYNKEYKIAIQELAVEYQKYLDMGGENTLSALSLKNEFCDVKALTSAYEELNETIKKTNIETDKIKIKDYSWLGEMSGVTFDSLGNFTSQLTALARVLLKDRRGQTLGINLFESLSESSNEALKQLLNVTGGFEEFRKVLRSATIQSGGMINYSETLGLDVLSFDVEALKKYFKLYQQLGEIIQETAQKQEKQKTTQKTSNVDNEAIRSVTRANKTLETQAGKTSTAIKNEANSAQSASEKFRKLAKEKGNATIANRELAKAAKETADALGREVKARKEAENSRGSKNAVDSGVYNAKALDWQIDIKQKLLDSGDYAEIYGAQISQLANGNVQFVASVRAMVDGVDDDWKKLTAVVDGNGNVVSRKFKDLSDKQIKDIEKAKEQARRTTEALAQAMNGEETEAVSYNRDAMEKLVTDAVKATQAIEGLNAEYKATLNSDGSITITKNLTEANGIIKTFTAEFEDVRTVVSAANSSVETFNKLLNNAFDKAKVSIKTKVDNSEAEAVISQYEEIYKVAQKLNSVELKLSRLDEDTDPHRISLLTEELKQLEQEYFVLSSAFGREGGLNQLTDAQMGQLQSVFATTKQKIDEVQAALSDTLVKQGIAALNKFEEKYKSFDGFEALSGEIDNLRSKVSSLSDEGSLDGFKKDIDNMASGLEDVKAQYDKLENLRKRMGELKINIKGLDDVKNINQLSLLENKLKTIKAEYDSLILEITNGVGRRGLPEGVNEKLNDSAEKVSSTLNEMEAKIQDAFVKQGADALDKFEKKYKSFDGFEKLSDEITELKGKILELSNAKELDKIKSKIEKMASALDKTKKLNDLRSQGKDLLDDFNYKHDGDKYYKTLAEDLAKVEEKIKGISDNKGLKEVKEDLSGLARRLKDLNADDGLGNLFEGVNRERVFGDINEVRANIDSLVGSIGKVNEKSIKVKGMNTLTAEVKKANGEIRKITINLDSRGFARYVDNGVKQFGRLREAAEGVFNTIRSFARIYLSPMDFVRYFRRGFDAVKEVDTALTELIKVSDASDNAIAECFDGAVRSAKELGSSVTDMISATSEWARLGYNLPNSKKLGEVAVLYKNVGDGIDIEAANESLVSTLQGFQLEADDALSIVDKFNEVSNNFAISSGGLGEALKRSASAFNAANTDLSGAIALITTGNEVVQSPEKVGTMWQTVSARIRGKFCAHCTVMCRPLYEDNILVA